jgi:hypothetical protein
MPTPWRYQCPVAVDTQRTLLLMSPLPKVGFALQQMVKEPFDLHIP